MGGEEQIERMQEDNDRKLAKQIGITYDELTQLDYDIHEETSEDGLEYNRYIEFNKDVSPEILKKIKGLDQNYWLYI